MRSLFGLLLVSFSCFGGLFDVGVKGGGQLTEGFSSATNFSDVSKRYIIGPMAELRLPFGFGVEADALYRKNAVSSGISTTSWQFPLLVKYRLPGLIVHPYVDGGPVFQHLSEISGLGPGKGFALGGGIEVRLGRIHISPELRYTRWGSPSTLSTFNLNQNQADALVGITF